MKPTNPFPLLLHAFFEQWLVQQRNSSTHTVRSYRDTWRLFLRFVSARLNRPVAQLTLQQLTAAEVLAFLQYIEEERKDSIGTRNCRLAALHSFFSFVADRDPLGVAQCAEVLRIPTKRAHQPAPCSLELHEVNAILAQPDRTRPEGQRDHALLCFLYNSGARIQEALDVCPQAIRFDSPAQVRLLGKGRKERFCPLWPETADLLKALLKRQPRADDKPIFVNRYREPLGASVGMSIVRSESGHVSLYPLSQTDAPLLPPRYQSSSLVWAPPTSNHHHLPPRCLGLSERCALPPYCRRRRSDLLGYHVLSL